MKRAYSLILFFIVASLLQHTLCAASPTLYSKPDAQGNLEYYHNGEKIPRDIYYEKQLEYGRSLITLTEDDRKFYDSVRNYNRTGNPDSLAIVEQELRNPESKYHENISSMLDLDEAALPAYLEYAKTERTYSGRYAIALALREATPTDAAVELLEAMIAERNNDGLISEMAISALEKYQAARSVAAGEDNAQIPAAPVDENEVVVSQVADNKSRTPLNEIEVKAESEAAPAKSESRPAIWILLIGVVVVVGVVIVVRRKS
jgi:hypothetical protein